MWRVFLVVIASVCFLGCGPTARESGMFDHSAMYKDFEHMRFSLYGFRNPTQETLKMSQERGWWGLEVPQKTQK